MIKIEVLLLISSYFCIFIFIFLMVKSHLKCPKPRCNCYLHYVELENGTTQVECPCCNKFWLFKSIPEVEPSFSEQLDLLVDKAKEVVKKRYDD